MAKNTFLENLTEEQVSAYKKLKRNNYDNVVVEIVGNWLWVSGDTKPHKTTLGKMGLIYSGPKKIWYMTDGQPTKKSRGYHTTMGHAKKFHKTVKVLG